MNDDVNSICMLVKLTLSFRDPNVHDDNDVLNEERERTKKESS